MATECQLGIVTDGTCHLAETRQFLRRFAKVVPFDRKYCMTVIKGAPVFLRYRMHRLRGDRTREWQLIQERTVVTGSVADGAAFCRWFNKSYATIELDIMSVVMNIPHHEQARLIHRVHGSPGYYRLVSDDAILNYCPKESLKKYPEFFQRFRQGEYSVTIPGQGSYALTPPIKLVMDEITKFKDNDREGRNLASVLFGISQQQMEIVAEDAFEGPAVNTKLTFKKGNRVVAELSMDKVFSMSLEVWPDIAKGWLDDTRRRFWPPERVLSEAKETTLHMVPKARPGSNDATMWRLSFSFIEKLLLSCVMENTVHRYVYFICKSLYYCHIKRISVKIPTQEEPIEMGSYTIKTTMLWMLEETDPVLWQMDDMGRLVRDFFTRLQGYLTSGSLPNFFVPDMNVLDGYPEELVEKVADLVGKIKEKPAEFIPDSMEEARQRGEEMLIIIENAYKVYELSTAFMPLGM